ncbi:MAG: sugar phosphate isomerase/epimerase family protein [Planctomycetia bacterium]|nr:sugar phosphate isomerase/epimerase family protein [Planctomycetia bacterium]
MNTSRRNFLTAASVFATTAWTGINVVRAEHPATTYTPAPSNNEEFEKVRDLITSPHPEIPETPAGSGARASLPIAVSTYSYWGYRPGQQLKMEDCIRLAAETGFDAVELLEKQIHRTDTAYLRTLKREAFLHGLSLCGLSTHQHFLSPDKEFREHNVRITEKSIELAYELGIPTIRINTGRWQTSRDFNELMRNKGIEPTLPGYTEEDAFPWVIEGIEKCIPTAEKCGVVLGLENHWGLGITAEGVLKIVDAIHSPWLQVTLDTGNFLENTYQQIEKLAPRAKFVQAKTYFGGGTWYTLNLDYARIADILRKAEYKGFISLEFEGREPAKTAIPKSLDMLRRAFSREA